MARTYNLTHLALNDATDADWALAYVRFALRDKPNEATAYPIDSLSDEEVNAALTAQALVDESVTPNVTYYAAHRVAAALVTGNPTWISRWSSAGVSEAFRDAEATAKAIIRAGRWIDQAIALESDGRLTAGQLRLVT